MTTQQRKVQTRSVLATIGTTLYHKLHTQQPEHGVRSAGTLSRTRCACSP